MQRELLFSVFPRHPSPSHWCIQNSQASQTQGAYEPCNLCFFSLSIKIILFHCLWFLLLLFFLKFLCFLNKNNPGLGSQKFNVLSCQIICFLFNLFVIQTSPHFCSDPGTVPRNVYVNTFLKAVIKITILTKTPQKNQPPYTRFPSDLLKSTRSQKRSKCAWFRFEASRQMKWPDICLLGLLSEELTKRVTAFKQLPGEEDICLCFTSYSVLRPCLEKSMWGLAAVVLRQPVVIWLLS